MVFLQTGMLLILISLLSALYFLKYHKFHLFILYVVKLHFSTFEVNIFTDLMTYFQTNNQITYHQSS